MKAVLCSSLVSILLLGACSSKILKTTSIPSIKDDSIGVVYHLPKALVPITISLESGEPTSSADGKPKPEGNVQTTTNNISITTGPEKPQKPDSNKMPKIPDLKALGSLSLKKNQYYKVTIGESKLVADTSKSYFLNYQPEFATDDVLAIGVGPNQLLQTTNSTSTDRSGDVAVMLAKIAIDSFRLAAIELVLPTPEVREKTQPTSPCAELKDIKVNTYLDVSAKDNEAFSKSKLTHKLKDTPISIKVSENPPCEDAQCLNPLPDPPEKSGVLFRALRSYKLTIKIDSNKTPHGKKWCDSIDIPTDIQEVNIMVPNNGPVYSVDVKRVAFVTKKTNLTIVDGMLTKIDLDKPSSLVGLVKIPLDILEAIIAIPSELLTARIKKVQDEGTLSKAQGDLLLNENIRLKNEKLLQQQRSPSASD